MADTKSVDLTAKKTEGAWIKTLDRFWLSAAPEMFKWLGWVAALSALTLVARRDGGWLVRGVLGAYYVAMLFYFSAFFFQFTFTNPPFVTSARKRHVVSLVISGLLAGLAQWLAGIAVDVIARAKF